MWPSNWYLGKKKMKSTAIPLSNRSKEYNVNTDEYDDFDELTKYKILLQEKEKLLSERRQYIIDLENVMHKQMQFMQDVIMELIISKKEEKPKVSPAMAAYLAKKDLDTTKSVKELNKDGAARLP